MIKYVMVIIILGLLMIMLLQFIVFKETRDKNQYITLKEVIPGARFISETEGIVEYEGKRFILGLTNFKRKQEIINNLNLLQLQGNLEIDLRFNRQVIVREK